MLRLDGAAFCFRMIFLASAAITAMFALENHEYGRRGEFYALLLVGALGMCLMASSADLIMLYLAIETTSAPLYVLAGFITRDPRSVEAGLKYLLFGAVTSAVMVYGFSLLYGFAGTTQIYELAGGLQAGQAPLFGKIVALMLVLAGFSFKTSAAPFHFWAPDVYEGAPTPVAGFLSTASKAAGFSVFMRVLFAAFPGEAPVWGLLVGLIASASMFIGNFLALSQKNIKRLLAYSSIAQAGYILIGVAADSQFGASGAIYYLMAYLPTNLAAFGIVTIAGHMLGSDEISAYAGLSRRSPGLALALLAALLSLGGIPPFAGFLGKLLVFGAAIQANMVWLALIGVLNAIVALYYYLTVLKVVYLYRSEGDTAHLSVSRSWEVALIICVLGIVLLGTFFAPWYNWSAFAAAGLF
jgi:NADH-quinone oxidoreductase subunit N